MQYSQTALVPPAASQSCSRILLTPSIMECWKSRDLLHLLSRDSVRDLRNDCFTDEKSLPANFRSALQNSQVSTETFVSVSSGRRPALAIFFRGVNILSSIILFQLCLSYRPENGILAAIGPVILSAKGVSPPIE